jgi:RNA polymerase sigma-70 factor (ECF subfamily)
MTSISAQAAKPDLKQLSDADLAGLCVQRNEAAIQYVITTNNQRLFRTAWSILKNRTEAEEAVQAAYMSAFANIGSFRSESALSTWLTRIVVNEALGRHRTEQRRRRMLDQEGVGIMDAYRDQLMRGSVTEPPDAGVAREQIRKRLESAVAALADPFRSVFVLREIEGLSSEETSEILDVPIATVKTRLFRARRTLQKSLAPDVRSILQGTFPFAGADCASLTERVLKKLGLQPAQARSSPESPR